MNIIFFITHKTLTKEHAEMTIKSLGMSKTPLHFDIMYIYNTHKDEITDEYIFELCKQYDLNSFINKIEVFTGNYPNIGSLVYDIRTIHEYVISKYKPTDKVLLLKSDCVLSINLLKELKKCDNLQKFILTPPFIVAKKRVTDDEIINYCSKDVVILSDNETFFNENTYATKENDHTYRLGVSPTDRNIKFISCTVKTDFSCHYLTVNCFDDINYHQHNTWGGVNFSRLEPYWIGTNEGFVVHKYHDIVSVNRPMPREGTIEYYMLS